ncbi:MAG: NAD(P)/FAD-dependent oxidoreductase, partial [Paracoccaceae bacterium]|nr:NAD(P)/FAD-dependent oxidoreductase [Paracoccaceae bacterium]
LFGLQEKPSHLLIIGAGPIGIEMAQAHARLGCRVTVLEADHALRHEDPEAAAIVLDRLRSEGVEIYEKVAVDSVSGGDEGVTVSLVGGRKIAGSHLLVAAGRKSNIEALGLDLAGIRSGQSIEVDRGLRTANRRVYAIGDVTGAPHFTHRAGYQAGLVVRSALFGLPAKERPEILPRVTFTEPELGQVGLTEAEASTKHGEALTVLRSEYSGNDRAQALGETNGFIKVMVVRGRPVGVTIVGHGAGEILSMWALAIGSGMKISTIATTVLPYPTLAEIGKRAAGTYFSERLFDSPWIKRAVRLVQKALP